ncbi:CheR family methyltransferase [Desulfomicrobium baculatum]|uniref:MCP methyltransferase, CheR-type n=1 Tax=Desulfomicrobium baculatum (strain DSM 4028 / VKM B-1378 / X) TaxID=525897 RepID=C7LSD7_DESBD|nr:protein-glutamate O-methyltransferase CheR [Desulfomicrobium baculatum]ACU88151.1 MCP methyltransferase, CheR-type [Desulfomicrobium baculatum DSM 4028]
MNVHPETERIELRLLLEAIYLKYGYDFRNYSMAHLKRRAEYRLSLSGLGSISQLQHAVLHDENMFLIFLQDLSINVSEMFRDPPFYKALRNDILPMLGTYPSFRIWHAGCSAGQEVYSMSILLHEAGMRERGQIYATDFNRAILEQAREAAFPLAQLKDYTTKYQQAGGENSFADYYAANDQRAVLRPFLKDRIFFSEHNLVTDGVFGEMHLIVCRNVLIYFDRELQDRVVGLFVDSLCPGGFLCLGSKESLKFSKHADKFEVVREKEKIYRKRRDA